MDLEKSNSKHVYFNQLEYLEKVLNQIERDFNMSGMDFENSLGTPKNYSELYSIVNKNISALFSDGSTQFKNLMYRIDISEFAIQKRLSSSLNLEIENVISELVIERCLLKVLSREKFS